MGDPLSTVRSKPWKQLGVRKKEVLVNKSEKKTLHIWKGVSYNNLQQKKARHIDIDKDTKIHF